MLEVGRSSQADHRQNIGERGSRLWLFRRHVGEQRDQVQGQHAGVVARAPGGAARVRWGAAISKAVKVAPGRRDRPAVYSDELVNRTIGVHSECVEVPHPRPGPRHPAPGELW